MPRLALRSARPITKAAQLFNTARLLLPALALLPLPLLLLARPILEACGIPESLAGPAGQFTAITIPAIFF